MIRSWLREGKANERSFAGNNLLFSAAGFSNLELLQMLVQEGNADLETTNDACLTVLQVAIKRGNISIVEYLVSKGVNTNGALHEAVSSNQVDCCHWLLDQHMDVNERLLTMKSGAGMTPLHYCCATVNTTTFNDSTTGLQADTQDMPLMKMTTYRKFQEEIFHMLLDRGADIDATDERLGYTALHFACASGQTNLVRLLLENGADPTIVAKSGNTPLEINKTSKHTASQWEISKILEEALDIDGVSDSSIALRLMKNPTWSDR
jgi:ankyrin repeat protein